MSDNNNTAGMAFLSFLVGMLFGGVLALLYAPKSGEELRGEIRQQYADTSQQLAEQYTKTMESVQKTVADTQEQLQAYIAKENAEEAQAGEEEAAA